MRLVLFCSFNSLYVPFALIMNINFVVSSHSSFSAMHSEHSSFSSMDTGLPNSNWHFLSYSMPIFVILCEMAIVTQRNELVPTAPKSWVVLKASVSPADKRVCSSQIRVREGLCEPLGLLNKKICQVRIVKKMHFWCINLNTLNMSSVTCVTIILMAFILRMAKI